MRNPLKTPNGWNDRLVESYDLIADSYAEDRFEAIDRKPFDRELLAHYAESVRGHGTVCDLGCGPGVVAEFLHRRGVDVVGIDISARMIEVARTRHPNIRFHRGDMRALHLRDASLAGIVSFYSILHVARSMVPRVLAEMMRVLRPGGVALLAVYEGEGEHHTDVMFDQAVSVETTLFPPGEVQMLLENAGFKQEDSFHRDPLDFEFQMRSIYVRAIRPTV